MAKEKRVEERVAYDLNYGKYIVGKPQGISGQNYHFLDACMIEKKDLPKEKSLEEGLREAYLKNPDRIARQIATSRVMSPQPLRFTIDVE